MVMFDLTSTVVCVVALLLLWTGVSVCVCLLLVVYAVFFSPVGGCATCRWPVLALRALLEASWSGYARRRRLSGLRRLNAVFRRIGDFRSIRRCSRNIGSCVFRRCFRGLTYELAGGKLMIVRSR